MTDAALGAPAAIPVGQEAARPDGAFSRIAILEPDRGHTGGSTPPPAGGPTGNGPQSPLDLASRLVAPGPALEFRPPGQPSAQAERLVSLAPPPHLSQLPDAGMTLGGLHVPSAPDLALNGPAADGRLQRPATGPAHSVGKGVAHGLLPKPGSAAVGPHATAHAAHATGPKTQSSSEALPQAGDHADSTAEPAIAQSGPPPSGAAAERKGGAAPPPPPTMPSLPASRFEGTQLLLTQIHAAAQAARQRYLEHVAQGAQAVRDAVQQQHQALTTATDGQETSLQSAFAQGRQQVSQSISGAHARLQTEAASHQASLEQWHATASARAQAAVTEKQQAAHGLGEEHAAQVTSAAGAAAAGAQAQTQALAQQARSVGQSKAGGGGTPEVAQAKAKVATDLAEDTATKVSQGVTELASSLHGSGAETASSFRQKGQEAAAQMAEMLPATQASLTSSRQQAADALLKAVSGAGKSLDGLHTQLLARMEAQEAGARTHLRTQAGEARLAIETAGQDAVARFQVHSHQSVTEGDARLAQFMAEAGGRRLTAAQAAAAAPEMAGQVDAAYAGLTAQTEGAYRSVVAGVAESGRGAATGLNAVDGAVRTHVQCLVGQADSHVAQQASSLTATMGSTVQGATAAGDGAVSQMETGLTDHVSRLRQGFATGVSSFQEALNAKVSTKVGQAQEPLGTLAGRIDAGQAKVAAKAEGSHKGWLSKAWDWVKDQLSQLWQMLKDPGFWVGLLIVVVAILLLPEELTLLAAVALMAVIGAVAAGAGTIVSNLYHDRPWSQGLLKNMAIGAAFGIVLTLAGAALPAGLASVVGLSLAAGGLTVVTNLVTGRPWDEGLLANMLLVGLFASLGKFFPRLGDVGSKDGKTPGDTSTPSQKPPLVEDPYTKLGKTYGFSEDALDTLRQNGIEAARIERLISRGVPPSEALRLGTTGIKAVEITESLLDRGLPPDDARTIAIRANEVGALDDVGILSRSPNFENPEVLKSFLNSLKKGSRGLRQALTDAAQRVSAGSQTALENGEADVVDSTAREAVQHKEVVGKSRVALFDNLKGAASQLRGDSGEVPPSGFLRIANISITDPANPFFEADRAALSGVLHQTPGLEGVDRFVITNGRGAQEFQAPDFN